MPFGFTEVTLTNPGNFAPVEQNWIYVLKNKYAPSKGASFQSIALEWYHSTC
jgi:hypothetical protein